MCSVGPVTVAFAGSMPMNEKANTVPFFYAFEFEAPVGIGSHARMAAFDHDGDTRQGFARFEGHHALNPVCGLFRSCRAGE